MPLYNPSSGGVSDGGTLSTGLTFPVAGLHILDTNATHDLIVSPGSNLTADRTLTIVTGDVDRSLTLTDNATVSGTNTGDQTTVSGNAGTVTVADAGGDTTTFVLLGTSATGSLSPATDAGITYNATTNTLTTTTFVGALTGDVTGNVSGSSGSCTGNAATATILATTRAIYGNNFDGSAALTQVIASTFGGTGNGFAKFSGPTTSEKTFTLPDATCTILTSNAVVTYSQGGTGLSALGTGLQVLRTNAGATAMEWATPAGGGDMLAANNLSDVVSAATSATNLGLGTSDSPQFTAINIGHASDTTLARVSAGVISVEGNTIYAAGGTDVALADGGTGASLTDPNADRILFWDDSAGAVTWLTAGTGLTITGTTIDASGGGGLSYFTEAQSTSSPNGTVYVSSVTASGAATNIDAAIVPKGTGAVLAQVPDSTTAGGNKRGSNAVDLQTSRAAATQVASASGSIICGGINNTASGSYSSVPGGAGNSATSTYAISAGGNTNVASGQSSGVFAGAVNTASGISSVVIGGGNSTASVENAVAIGRYVAADHHGEIACGAGRISADGDTQHSFAHWRKQTTNNTQAEIFLDGSSARFTVASDVTYGFELHVVARRTDADNESAYWIIRGCIDNNGGTTALVGSIAIDTVADDSAGAWSVTAEADNTNDALVVKVTGATSKTLNWTAAGHMIKVKG